MAQHDYDIANQSGSAFRADLNNALAAIVSDNSGSSAPTPTFAYQTWIDSSTNPATIKRRDASNANWVTVGTVDGAGSATAPGFAVGSGTTYKPGIYSPGTDQLALATGGSGRLFVDSSGNVGIGATPTSLFSVRGNTPAINIDDVSNTSSKIVFRPAVLSYAERGGLSINYSSGEQRLFAGASGTGYFQTFYTDSSERLRITSTGALNFVGAGTAGSTQAVSFNGSAPVNSLVIDSSGRCGIGTSSVQSLLNISSTNPVFTFTRNNNTNASGAINFAGTDNIVKWQIGTNQSTGVGFEINRGDSTNNALYIDTSNRVGIGTTSPSSTLSVGGNPPTSGAIGAVSSSGGIALACSDNVNSSLYIRTASGGAVIGTDAGGALRFASNGNAGSDEKARIDSSGRLLLGTSTSAGKNSKLQIGLTSYDAAEFYQYSNDGFGSYISLAKSRGASVGTQTIVNSGDEIGTIEFNGYDGSAVKSAANIKAYVDAAPGTNDMPGRLVFSTTVDGTASPTEMLRLDNNGALSSRRYISNSPGGDYWQFNQSATGSSTAATLSLYASSTAARYHISFYSQGNVVGSISSTSSATTYATSSDYRLKENVVPLTGAADRINQLQVHRFNFIADPDRTVDGFIAHEAQAVVPECVTGEKDAVDDDGNPVYQGIDQSKLVPLLTAALQEALAKIEALEARLTAAGI